MRLLYIIAGIAVGNVLIGLHFYLMQAQRKSRIIAELFKSVISDPLVNKGRITNEGGCLLENKILVLEYDTFGGLARIMFTVNNYRISIFRKNQEILWCEFILWIPLWDLLIKRGSEDHTHLTKIFEMAEEVSHLEET